MLHCVEISIRLSILCKLNSHSHLCVFVTVKNKNNLKEGNIQ